MTLSASNFPGMACGMVDGLNIARTVRAKTKSQSPQVMFQMSLHMLK